MAIDWKRPLVGVRRRQSPTPAVAATDASSFDDVGAPEPPERRRSVQVVAIDLLNQPHSAREASEKVALLAAQVDPDARLFLVVSADVNSKGLARTWDFHYLFPSEACEGIFTTQTGSAASGDGAEVMAVITPFPLPGTPEHV